MFMGRYEHKVDSRDRLSIPAKFREELIEEGQVPIITCGFEKCLFLYTRQRWEQFSSAAEALHTSRENARNLERFLFANAEEAPLDKQGRILLQNHLKEHASLANDVIVMGVRNRIEIWDKREWKKQSNMITQTAKDIAEMNEEFSI